MPIIYNGETFSNGGSATGNLGNGDVSLSAIQVSIDGGDPVQVWKKEQQFSGGTVQFNNINKTNEVAFVSGMDLRGFSTISFNISGNNGYGANVFAWALLVRYTNGGGESWFYGPDSQAYSNFNRNFTVTLSTNDSYKTSVGIWITQSIDYEVATGVYSRCNMTCGTITAT